MKSKEFIKPPVYLTTTEAARLTGYTPDHIGLLRRRGRLTGEKRGRDWFISFESLEIYVKSNPKAGRPKS
jgi:excisionase family DNA binding protein